MADFENVVEVRLVAAGARPGEAHVTNASGHLHQLLAGHFRVGLPADAVIGEEAIQLGGVHHLPADEIDGRLAEDANVLGGVESVHRMSFAMLPRGDSFPNDFRGGKRRTRPGRRFVGVEDERALSS